MGQILLGDLDEAVAEIAQIAKLGLRGGVLLPGVVPGTGIPPLYAERWEPLWAACEEAGVVVNHHGGSAGPARPTGGAARLRCGCMRRTGGRIGRCGT
ncbi:amidohydrolase family protein [Mycobacterium xenopi 4042]|uniref:Amidohydrolase family protein n=1 Tax=Mycobacterium xenopi 4042 TaxID=1299334 RepID=X8CK89_MYCXE|nr:amidohydrolase family protein [Mycobacterium xenopi 3993]EUA56529.1 amidohydrolase family protein [Mycobacterium xenopi 4042]